MTHETFKTWLKEKLTASGLSAKEFADKARLSKPLVYFYLSGQRIPTADTLPRIARALGASVEEAQHLVRKGMGRPPKP